MTNILTLPKEFAEKGLKALRETPEDIHQTGYYYERISGKYCAMGLMLKANGHEFIPEGTKIKDITKDPFLFKDGQYDDKFYLDLFILNDNYQLTFKEIANWIEQNVEFV